MVAGAPSWRQALERIVQYTGSEPLVCHNAGFDMSVIRSACIADDLSCPSVDFLCTMVLARRAYRLPFVAAECDVDFSHHHQAVSDARCVPRTCQNSQITTATSSPADPPGSNAFKAVGW